MTTLKEAEIIISNAAIVKHEKQRMEELKKRMHLLKQSREARKDYTIEHTWKPTIILQKSESSYYNSRDVTIQIEIPYSVVEQSLVYEMDECRRKIIKSGGMA